MIVYGNLHSISTIPHNYYEFEVLNELKDLSSRSDSNCLYHTRFVFECDDIDKKLQIDNAIKLSEQGIIVRATDSGNKSIHCIVEFDSECEDICRDYYKEIWHAINELYFNGDADNACANPARLTRRPGAIRKNGNRQDLIIKNDNNIISKSKPAFRIIWRHARAFIATKTIIYSATKKRVLDSGLNDVITNDNLTINYDVIQHYLNTAYPKLTGNGDSSISLFKAIRCCIKYRDNSTLEKVLTKAKNEHWSEIELNRIIKNVKEKYV